VEQAVRALTGTHQQLAQYPIHWTGGLRTYPVAFSWDLKHITFQRDVQCIFKVIFRHCLSELTASVV
jgi:hypothetical protein